MTIALLCPNGHRLICPEQQAGKRGKCPQCGATFRVPELTGLPAAGGSSPGGSSPKLAAGSSPSNVPLPLDSSVGSATGSAPSLLDIVEPAVPENPIKPYNDGDAVGEQEIIFLCPEGHHLSGATSLSGKPGQCPVCQTKFIVPSEDDLSEPEPQEAQSPLMFNFDLGTGGATATTAAAANGEQEAAEEASKVSALAELFESFWSYKAQGASVEVHLAQGKVLTPDGFAPHLSRQDHGVFMIREANGLHTLAAVRWDAVSHITVRAASSPRGGV